MMKSLQSRIDFFQTGVLLSILVSCGTFLYFILYRTSAMRDIVDLRNSGFVARSETQDVQRTALGVGKSLDAFREAERVRVDGIEAQVKEVSAEFAEQVATIQRIANWAAGILTAVLVAAIIAWFKL